MTTMDGSFDILGLFTLSLELKDYVGEIKLEVITSTDFWNQIVIGNGWLIEKQVLTSSNFPPDRSQILQTYYIEVNHVTYTL